MKKIIKYLALLTALTTIFAVMDAQVYAKPAEDNSLDMSLVFSPETQLVVYADGVRYDFTIPATRGGKTDHFDCFEDYPIDIDICLDADCQYVVCFDRTSGMDEQIRFASWDGSNSVSIPWE